ncbi:nucleoside diphosphate kinase regulator [Ottowia thiooxydans]|uniref:nucleoside diphosphate kinase regulator n=1 Tax=Ottowia thiooxydans TaxID=219182 RepID=UPI0003FB5DA3|nr:nucleoside diphosphate kinase regulator [Ottowia thiooxydans]
MTSNVQVVRRVMTELDHVRIYNLLKRQYGSVSAPQAEELGEAIDNADLVCAQEIGPDIVTMYSKLRVFEVATGEERSITLCYPPDADAATGMISVLSPVGTSLLGLKVGDVARWHVSDGKESALEVRAIEFQPEASGDYTA